jgi:alpha-L-rhamnosidase
MEIHIPPNSSARVFIPTPDESGVREGDMQAAHAEGVTFLRQENGHAIYQLGSGDYHFEIPNK